MRMRLVDGGQRARLQGEEWAALDRRIHSLAMLAAAEREVARRMARRRVKRALKTPALWLVAALGAFLSWFGRQRG